MTIEVTVDPDLCIGSGDCVRILGAAFRIDEARGVSEPLPGSRRPGSRRCSRGQRSRCPTQSIRLVAADGTVIHESN